MRCFTFRRGSPKRPRRPRVDVEEELPKPYANNEAVNDSPGTSAEVDAGRAAALVTGRSGGVSSAPWSGGGGSGAGHGEGGREGTEGGVEQEGDAASERRRAAGRGDSASTSSSGSAAAAAGRRGAAASAPSRRSPPLEPQPSSTPTMPRADAPSTPLPKSNLGPPSLSSWLLSSSSSSPPAPAAPAAFINPPPPDNMPAPTHVHVVVLWARGRGLHSSTFRLNVSTLCGIHTVHDFPLVY